MNTIFADRLQGDPRFKALVRVIGDPLKAIGALYYVWNGTQNLHMLEATEDQLMDCFPLGYRGVKPALRALTETGWLVKQDTSYRVTGNESHVISAKTISEKNRAAAIARWDAERMRNAMRQASEPHAPPHANAMRGDARSDPSTVQVRSSTEESAPARAQGEDSSMPKGDRLLEYQAMTVPVAIAKAVRDAWADELLKHRKLPMPLMPTPKELEAFKQVVLMAGGQATAETIARAFVHCEDPKGYFKRVGWAPWLLAEDRNFAEARARAAVMMTAKAS